MDYGTLQTSGYYRRRADELLDERFTRIETALEDIQSFQWRIAVGLILGLALLAFDLLARLSTNLPA